MKTGGQKKTRTPCKLYLMYCNTCGMNPKFQPISSPSRLHIGRVGLPHNRQIFLLEVVARVLFHHKSQAWIDSLRSTAHFPIDFQSSEGVHSPIAVFIADDLEIEECEQPDSRNEARLSGLFSLPCCCNWCHRQPSIRGANGKETGVKLCLLTVRQSFLSCDRDVICDLPDPFLLAASPVV